MIIITIDIVIIIINTIVIIALSQGAVQYGLDPSIVHVRRAKCTYGIGVIRPFVQVILLLSLVLILL